MICFNGDFYVKWCLGKGSFFSCEMVFVDWAFFYLHLLWARSGSGSSRSGLKILKNPSV